MKSLLLRWVLTGLVVLAVPLSASAQGIIEGTVTDRDTDEELPGVNVVIEDLQQGAVTDGDGEFTISDVPAGTYTLQARFVGYEPASQEVTVADNEVTTVNFTLRATAIDLDEVVVTGTGREARRRELGATVSSVDVTELEEAPVTSMSQLLQGRSPGVNMLAGGGKAGEASRIIIRGPNSVTQSVQPIVYVDGVRIDNSTSSGVWTGGYSWSGLDDINPADIERIEIVKGAAAATLYGTEASSGVIQVFTKQGRTGRPQWSYQSEFGAMNTPLDWWDVSVYSPWFHENFVRTGIQQEQQLSARGGVEGFNYYVSGTYRTTDGVLPNGGQDHASFKTNIQLLPTDNMRVNAQVGYTQRDMFAPQDANNIYGYGINALAGGEPGMFLAPELIELIEVHLQSGRLNASGAINYTPFEGLTSQLSVGIDMLNVDNTEFQPYAANSHNPQGRKENFRRNARTLSLEFQTNFETEFAGFISSNTSAGFQGYDKNVGGSNAFGRDFPAPGLSVVNAAAVTEGGEYRQHTQQAGFFLQQNLGFYDIFFITAGLRADGHSAFGEDYPYQVYPSGSVSYVLSDHDFWPEDIASMRLRAAYGTAGRQPGVFDAVRTWSAISAADGQPAVTPGNLGNPVLAPEVSHEFEAGFESSILDDRLTLDFSYYHQRTEDALLNVMYPPSQGFLSTQLENVGELLNEGIELAANVQLLEGRDFRWEVQGNVATNRNKILDLGDEEEIYQHWTQAHREGYPVGSFFEDRHIEHNGEVGLASELLQDANGELPEGWDYIGPAFPTLNLQFSTNATLFRNWNVRLMVDHASGHYVESSTFRWIYQQTVPENDPVLPDMAGEPVARWCQNPDPGSVMEAVCDNPWPNGPRGDVVLPADYWKLREVTVSYRVPERFHQGLLRNMTVYLSGRNLLRSQTSLTTEVETNYSPQDLSNQDYFGTPHPRHIIGGLRIGF